MAVSLRLTWLTAAGLAACAPAAPNQADTARPAATPPEAEAHDTAYIMRGLPQPNRSSGWVAVLARNRLLLDSPTSAGWYAVTLPEPQLENGRRTYAADHLTLTVEPGACAFREVYPGLPDRIRLEWDSGSFEGCGGPRAASTQIAGTAWELVRLGADHVPATRSPAATLVFGTDGSVGGTLNCNDGGLRSSWTGQGGFIARGEGFEQTAIGCYDAGETFGRRFWNAMHSARAWRRDGERLFITFADGSEAELRYLI